jgi:uncharacterized phage protein gp47/JayE
MSDFARPTRSDLVARAKGDLNGRLPGADSRLRRSVVGAVATMHAGGLDSTYGYLDGVADQLFADSCTLANLVRKASLVGITPKAATPSAGSIAGADVPNGTIFNRGDGVQYVTTSDQVIGGGVVLVQCSLPGAAGDCDAGVQLTLASPISGVGSVFTVGGDGLSGGFDAEKQSELLARYYQRVRTPPKGGGPGDYIGWALKQPGVTRAWELPLWMGLGTVGLTFVYDDRSDIIPTGDDVAAMQAFIDGIAPMIGTNYVFAPTPYPVDFTITPTPATATVEAAIEAELEDFFFRIATPGGTMLRTQYCQAIGAAAGIVDYLVPTPGGNIVAPAGYLPVPGVFTW